MGSSHGAFGGARDRPRPARSWRSCESQALHRGSRFVSVLIEKTTDGACLQKNQWEATFQRTLPLRSISLRLRSLANFVIMQHEKEVGVIPYQAWFFSFLSSLVAQVARVFVLFVLDLLPSASSSCIMGLASTNFSTSFPNAVHKSLQKKARLWGCVPQTDVPVPLRSALASKKKSDSQLMSFLKRCIWSLISAGEELNSFLKLWLTGDTQSPVQRLISLTLPSALPKCSRKD